jgi:hypothetical protein
MWRAAPSWAEALLVGCVTTAALVLFSAACAQPTGSADLSVTKTVKLRVITGREPDLHHKGDQPSWGYREGRGD